MGSMMPANPQSVHMPSIETVFKLAIWSCLEQYVGLDKLSLCPSH
jgi:hypothetical protein